VTGDSTQHRGVEPDIALPSLLDTNEIGESARDSALPWDRINAARFTPEETALPGVTLLSREHQQRIANNPDFVALQGDVEALATLRSQREISLNLEQRRAERDAQDATRLQRENARRTAHGLTPLADIGALDGADAPDPVLDEAVEIAADAAKLPETRDPSRLS
jgi:carboxyl-terminal processing protease